MSQNLLTLRYSYVWQRMPVSIPSNLWINNRSLAFLDNVILTENSQPLQTETGDFLLVE